MSAGIWDSRFAARKDMPWHNFVKEIWPEDERVSAEDAVRRAGCDFDFRHVPMHIVLGGKRITIDDKVALVRMPIVDANGDVAQGHKVVSVVHKNYPVFQNLELGRMLNPVSDAMPVESLAALEDGAQIFICFNAGEAYVKGLDPIKQYITMSEFRDGVRAFEMFHTDVRTVCTNTYNAGIDNSVGRVSIGHSHGNFKSDAAYWSNVVTRLRVAQKSRVSIYDRLADELIPDDDYINSLMAYVYPLKPKPRKVVLADKIAENKVGMDDGEIDIDDILERVQKDRERWEYDNELVLARRAAVKGESLETTNDQMPPSMRGSKWAIFNAVTQYENFRDGRGASPKELGLSVMFGPRASAMNRAFKAVTTDAHLDAEPVAVG